MPVPAAVTAMTTGPTAEGPHRTLGGERACPPCPTLPPGWATEAWRPWQGHAMLGGRVQWRDVPELSLAVAVGLSFFCLGNAALHDAGTDDTPPLKYATPLTCKVAACRHGMR